MWPGLVCCAFPYFPDNQPEMHSIRLVKLCMVIQSFAGWLSNCKCKCQDCTVNLVKLATGRRLRGALVATNPLTEVICKDNVDRSPGFCLLQVLLN